MDFFASLARSQGIAAIIAGNRTNSSMSVNPIANRNLPATKNKIYEVIMVDVD